jgi:hypothetical protein
LLNTRWSDSSQKDRTSYFLTRQDVNSFVNIGECTTKQDGVKFAEKCESGNKKLTLPSCRAICNALGLCRWASWVWPHALHEPCSQRHELLAAVQDLEGVVYVAVAEADGCGEVVRRQVDKRHGTAVGARRGGDDEIEALIGGESRAGSGGKKKKGQEERRKDPGFVCKYSFRV